MPLTATKSEIRNGSASPKGKEKEKEKKFVNGNGRRRTIMLHLEDVTPNKGVISPFDDDGGAPDLDPDGDADSNTEFNLRDEVMACIAKSIGLLQPSHHNANPSQANQNQRQHQHLTPTSHPYSSSHSHKPLSPGSSISQTARSSPGLRPTFGSSYIYNDNYNFQSLSMLDDQDESSSMAASEMTSSSAIGADGHGGVGRSWMSGLDNEVEILFFPAGSVLVKAGERNAGR